jgi:hypothetical protein
MPTTYRHDIVLTIEISIKSFFGRVKEGCRLPRLPPSFPKRTKNDMAILTIALLAFCRYTFRVMNDGWRTCNLGCPFDVRASANFAGLNPHRDRFPFMVPNSIVKAALPRPASAPTN